MATPEEKSGVEQLYKNFGILADAGEKGSEHVAAYEGILQAAKGTANEKKLAAGFITRFYHLFPSLAETAMDSLLDLVEEENDMIRRTAIKALPDVCRRSPDPLLLTKVAEYLTQLLATDDSVDLSLVKNGLSSLLQKNSTYAMDGIFSQVVGEDEGVREKAIEYISSSLMEMRPLIFTDHPDNEKHLTGLVKKVLQDVTGEEFEVFIDVLSKLHSISSSPSGAQEVMALIVEQADMTQKFNPKDSESVDKFITCFKQALKFCKRGCSVAPFLCFLSSTLLPSLSPEEEGSRQEVLQLLAEGCLLPVDTEWVGKGVEPVFNFLLTHIPLPPADENEPPSFQYSVVECVLFAFHQLVQKVPEFLTAEENTERLKDFKKRLQYFARNCQTYHSSLQAAVKSAGTGGGAEGGAGEGKEEQAKLRSVALKITANINTLIRDFFHNPPSYQAKINLSWGPEVHKPTSIQRKRQSTADTIAAGATPPKRKPSPIRFDASDSKPSSPKRDSQSFYQPPYNRFSKSISNGSFPRGGGGGAGGGRGGGAGGGGVGGRGKRGGSGRGSWRVY